MNIAPNLAEICLKKQHANFLFIFDSNITGHLKLGSFELELGSSLILYQYRDMKLSSVLHFVHPGMA